MFWALENQRRLSKKKNRAIEEETFGLESEELTSLPKKSRKELLEERLATLCLKYKFLLGLLSRENFDCLSPQVSELVTCLKENKKISDDLINTFNPFFLKAEIESEEEDRKEVEEEFEKCLKEIKCITIKEKLDNISKAIKKAEEEKDSKNCKKLTQEFNRLIKQIP